MGFFGLPWLRVEGRPAFLLHLVDRRAYLFGGTYTAEDFWLVFFVLTGIGFSLFVVSAIWGRVWCGFACPHTVLLEGVYRKIERMIEGTAAQRRRLDDSSWTGEKIRKRGTKWLLFAVLSLAVSHTMLSYFMGTDEVLAAVTSPPTEHWGAFLFVVVFSLIVYGNFAWFREQLCIAICPYGRLQGALYDRDTVNVTYDHVRGEPRKGKAEQGVSTGDCIDCYRCVAVCPTGIDIRNGTQLECVGCANCIDACDEIMEKVGKPKGLIRFDSQNGVESEKRRFWRPRVFAYAALMLIGASVFTAAISWRESFETQVLRPGQTYVVDESTDLVRNIFTVRVDNKAAEAQKFVVTVEAPDKAQITLPQPEFEVEAYGERKVPMFVSVPRSEWTGKFLVQVRVQQGEAFRVEEVEVLGPDR